VLPPASSQGEHSVLKWFLACLFALALVVIAVTWFRQDRACAAEGAAAGHSRSELSFSGGARLGLAVMCSCKNDAAGPSRK
jgi:hypothetical protein